MAISNVCVMILVFFAASVFVLDMLDEFMAFSPVLLMTTEYAPPAEEDIPQLKSIWL